MAQLLPPKRSNRPKNKTIMAIILAILLHVLVAIVLYFTIFQNTSTSDTLPSIDERPLPASIITEGEQVSSHDTKIVTANINEQKTDALPADSVDKQSAQLTANDKSHLTDKIKNSADSTKQAPTLDTKSRTAKVNNHSTKEPIPLATANNNTATDIKPSGAEPSDQPEYKLEQTKETQQLNADIDKDSEQLSKLIDEVKKRNQQQINQHSSNLSSAQPESATAPDNSTIKQDYPITPITPLIDQQEDN